MFRFGCSFTFLIVVGRLESVHHNRIINTIHSVYFMKLLRTMAEHKHVRTSWTPASEQNQIFWEDEKNQQIFIYFKFHFHHDGGPGERSHFEVFFSEWGKSFVCKIWSSSDTPNRFFANKCHIFYKYPMGLFFPQYLYSCSPVRTGMIRFGSKLSKN